MTIRTTFTWDEANDDWVIALIREKMEQGFQFWVTKRSGKKKPLRDAAKAAKWRKVMIWGDGARDLLTQTTTGVTTETQRRLHTDGGASVAR
jgi:hypothetical protein